MYWIGSGLMTMLFWSSVFPSDAWSKSQSDSFSHLSGLQEKLVFSGFHKRQFLQGISELELIVIQYHEGLVFDISVMKRKY